jgi:hypothetical protein
MTLLFLFIPTIPFLERDTRVKRWSGKTNDPPFYRPFMAMFMSNATQVPFRVIIAASYNELGLRNRSFTESFQRSVTDLPPSTTV